MSDLLLRICTLLTEFKKYIKIHASISKTIKLVFHKMERSS